MRTLEYETVTGRLNKISENNGMSYTFIYNDAGQLNQERLILPNQQQKTNYYHYSLAN
ncbi:hypothetical protein [Arsenophonus endosymbiont of Aleurodicus floccissimus]|uniref:hypothetical protein n=1 Tax=Arsenophonus endosymbiont of Aleurodicus floccissimus TaxID=2152761 RepID=UPI001600BB19|nr:hypothetical protein [Arsenophonus endosymbiont of Aleurodicus floccissimus]